MTKLYEFHQSIVHRLTLYDSETSVTESEVTFTSDFGSRPLRTYLILKESLLLPQREWREVSPKQVRSSTIVLEDIRYGFPFSSITESTCTNVGGKEDDGSERGKIVLRLWSVQVQTRDTSVVSVQNPFSTTDPRKTCTYARWGYDRLVSDRSRFLFILNPGIYVWRTFMKEGHLCRIYKL